MKYFEFKNVKDAADTPIKYLLGYENIETAGIWQTSKQYEEYKMIVLRNLVMEITGINWEPEKLLEETGCDKEWCIAHFKERISGNPTNPGEAYKDWPYHRNLDNSEFKDEIFSHTYQERFWPKGAGVPPYTGYPLVGIRYELGDLNDLINQLKQNPKTRQAWLPIWFPEDTWAAANNKRVPCTLGYYFYIESNKLHTNYIIRSCDAYRHYRNDLYFTLSLQQYVANNLQLEPGELNMNIFNFHLFVNDKYNITKRDKERLK